MSKVLRAAVAAYLVFLTVGVIAGQWVLQGPVLIGATANHGVHVGDLIVTVLTAIAMYALLRGPRR
jgi:hypothetical protein